MMPVISFVSQKGGVGKSTLARALARDAAAGGLSVLIADLDVQQLTAVRWAERREKAGIEPKVPVRKFSTVAEALAAEDEVDLIIIDGPAKASAQTLELAQNSALVVVPSNPGEDDLRPAVELLQGLVSKGIPKERLAAALVRTGTDSEEAAARAYFAEADEGRGFEVLPGALVERPAYRIAQNAGEAVTEVRFAGLSRRADEMVQAIVDRATA